MEKVLLVDDEPEILRSLTRYLREDFEILTAESAREALEVYERENPSVVVTDIRMPGMDGIELMRQVKSLQGDGEFIVVTGHGDMSAAQEAMEMGAVDFLLKPIDVGKLLDSIAEALAKLKKKRGILQHFEGTDLP